MFSISSYLFSRTLTSLKKFFVIQNQGAKTVKQNIANIAL